MNSAVRQHKTYLDILRIMASFLVCYNHAYAYHLFLDQEADGSLVSWINVILSVLTTIDLPLFFMISGALLLGKKESYKELYSKRILRFVVLIVVASAVVYCVLRPEGFSFRHFVYQLPAGQVNGSYWYLFAYLSFLLMLPFLRRIAEAITQADMIHLILVRTVLIPGMLLLNLLLRLWDIPPVTLTEYLRVPLATFDFMFYPMTGYYLAEKVKIEQFGRKHLGCCFGVLVCGTLVAAWATYTEGILEAFSQTYLGLFNYTSAMAVFLIVRYALCHISLPAGLARFLSAVSSVTIGIYLFEPLTGHYLYVPFFASVPWNPLTITVFSVLWCFVCMSIGGSATYLLRKIPGVKKFL